MLQNTRRERVQSTPTASPKTYNSQPTPSTLAPPTVPCCPVCTRPLVIRGGVRQLDLESRHNHLRLACANAACAVEVWGLLEVTGQSQASDGGASMTLKPGSTSCACTRAAYGLACQCGTGVRP